MSCSFILVDYKTIDNTIEYISHCRQNVQGLEEFHFIVVDNTSTDSVDSFRAVYGEEKGKNTIYGCPVYEFLTENAVILYCPSGENGGFAKGNNLGAHIAKERFGDDVYIISNNDLVFLAPFDYKRVETVFKEDESVGVWGPKIYKKKMEQQSPKKFQTAFKKLIFWYWNMALGNVFYRWIIGTDFNVKSGYVDWVMGCFFAVRADYFWQIDGLDEHTFLYAEEMILSRRMEKIGKKVYYDEKTELLHNHQNKKRDADAALRDIIISFESNYYYYKTYRKTFAPLLWWAKVNFALYKGIFVLEKKIKKIFKKA